MYYYLLNSKLKNHKTDFLFKVINFQKKENNQLKGQAQNNQDGIYLTQTVNLTSFKNQTIKIHIIAASGDSRGAYITIKIFE